MRRLLMALAMTGALLAANGCTPTTTVTANPSTTKPACKAITTVTGKVTPPGTITRADLEVQKNGKWESFYWFTDTTGGRTDISAAVSKTTGNYSMQYLAPTPQFWPATIRLRVRVHNLRAKIDTVSTSWYVTYPKSC